MRARANWRFMAVLLAVLAPHPAAAGPTAEFDTSAFAAAQAQGRTIVVETYAAWCLPCRIQAPILDRLRSRDPFTKVLVFRIGERTPNVTWKRFRLNGFGNLVVFKGGRETARGTPTNESAFAALLRMGI